MLDKPLVTAPAPIEVDTVPEETDPQEDVEADEYSPANIRFFA